MAKKRMRKLTAIVPEELLQKVTRATGSGVTPTVRMGLKLLAAQGTYTRLRKPAGK